ncbi:hypothetical protein EJ06DRAFT_408721 [Trichodelitschia bisporula]|uniref:Uncharacterized protein n=1 Tax=Trichodelitschia bisporula TaxID=703511 RepID=A0A6G1HYE5_9PEZI|nr:hypothetical protein EJ06DRAFT_408721 [Trichodelitschia bisporula]
MMPPKAFDWSARVDDPSNLSFFSFSPPRGDGNMSKAGAKADAKAQKVETNTTPTPQSNSHDFTGQRAPVPISFINGLLSGQSGSHMETSVYRQGSSKQPVAERGLENSEVTPRGLQASKHAMRGQVVSSAMSSLERSNHAVVANDGQESFSTQSVASVAGGASRSQVVSSNMRGLERSKHTVPADVRQENFFNKSVASITGGISRSQTSTVAQGLEASKNTTSAAISKDIILNKLFATLSIDTADSLQVHREVEDESKPNSEVSAWQMKIDRYEREFAALRLKLEKALDAVINSGKHLKEASDQSPDLRDPVMAAHIGAIRAGGMTHMEQSRQIKKIGEAMIALEKAYLSRKKELEGCMAEHLAANKSTNEKMAEHGDMALQVHTKSAAHRTVVLKKARLQQEVAQHEADAARIDKELKMRHHELQKARASHKAALAEVAKGHGAADRSTADRAPIEHAAAQDEASIEHHGTQNEDDQDQDDEAVDHPKFWPIPVLRQRTDLRAVRLLNIPEGGTIQFVERLIWGGPLERLDFTPGQTTAVATFMCHKHLVRYYRDAHIGVEWPDSSRVVDLEILEGTPPLERRWEAISATRCVRITGLPSHWSIDACTNFAGASANNIVKVRTGKTDGHVSPPRKLAFPLAQLIDSQERAVEYRFNSVQDADALMTKVRNELRFKHCAVVFADDPCQFQPAEA